MARDKTDETDKTPAATPATQEGEAQSGKTMGLLGGEPNFFSIVGLGLGASDRAKILVIKGLKAELDEKRKRLEAQLERKRGRPRKDFPNIDIQRAAAVLGADEFSRDRMGHGVSTQKAAIDLAAQIDKILCEHGERDKPLFGDMTSFARLQNSVSAGLRELGIGGERFTKK